MIYPLNLDGEMCDHEGFLVFDSKAQEVLSSGLGADAQVVEMLGALWRNRHSVPLERVSILEGLAQPILTVAIGQSDAICFLIFTLREGDKLAKFLASVPAAPDILRHLLTNPDPAKMVVEKVAGAIEQVSFKGSDTIHRITAELSNVTQKCNLGHGELSSLCSKSHYLDKIVGRSDAVRKLKEDICRIASLDVPVLLIGESGTGKEMVANAIHMLSPRRDKTLVPVNSAAISPSLIESELFGYEPGALTGADRKGRKGKFEAADGGTLLLDEIGDMPVDMQVKLLRVLQDGRFERIGDQRIRHSDFRLISASNRDFSSMIAESRFRLDLFYRISAVTLRIPPLRERLEDIPELSGTFLRDLAVRHGTPTKSLTADAVHFLQSRPWPGNIRQLQHAIEHAVIFSNTDLLRVNDFSMIDVVERSEHASSVVCQERVTNVRAAQTKLECELILLALSRTGGNKKRAAQELGISRSYLYKRLNLMETESAMGQQE